MVHRNFASMLSIKKIAVILSLLFANSVYATEPVKATEDDQEFHSDEILESGFVTSKLISTDNCSVPILGGYFIGKYTYSDKADDDSGNGLNARLVLMYVDGTLLNDFKYRLQVRLDKTPSLEEYFLEWTRYDAFHIKIGQFKRPFTMENSFSPWYIGLGDFSQATTKLAGLDDYNGESSMGGRDQGLQIQGELLKIGNDSHHLFQYQVGVFNGQGINHKDANKDKDIIGNIKVQPIKGLLIGASAWNGKYTADGVTVNRKRWAVGATCDVDGWIARAEYVRSNGHKISELMADGTITGTGEADGWYALMGVPCRKWLQVFGRYDAYRDQATWGSLRTIYSVCPNFQLHKNLVFQLQYNYVCDKTLADSHYNELWMECYVRF
jgi:hypothetical protein